MKRFLLVSIFFLTGCATPLNDTTVVSLINNRLNNVEQKLQTNPPGVKNRPEGEDGELTEQTELTEKQKEFILLMMDYLGKK